jgi:hypothetical protein
VFGVSQGLIEAMCETIPKTGPAVFLIRIKCKTCHLLFYLCRSCFRGHVYCCDQCRFISTKKAHRKAQSRYRTSEKGRRANQIAAKRRRTKKKQESVADEGSILPSKNGMLPPSSLLKKIMCLFCGISGKAVTRFPRRGYKTRLVFRDVDSTGTELVESKPMNWRHHATYKDSRPHPNSPDP